MEPLTALLGMGFPIVFFIAALLAGGVKVVNQYERGVVLHSGALRVCVSRGFGMLYRSFRR